MIGMGKRVIGVSTGIGIGTGIGILMQYIMCYIPRRSPAEEASGSIMAPKTSPRDGIKRGSRPKRKRSCSASSPAASMKPSLHRIMPPVSLSTPSFPLTLSHPFYETHPYPYPNSVVSLEGPPSLHISAGQPGPCGSERTASPPPRPCPCPSASQPRAPGPAVAWEAQQPTVN